MEVTWLPASLILETQRFQVCKDVESISSCSSADGEYPEFLQPGDTSYPPAWHGMVQPFCK